jgi:hypothetical protein
MSSFWLWTIIVVLCFIIYWSWSIISGIAEDLLKTKHQVKNLSVALQNSNYELDCLKKSIIATNTGVPLKHAMPLQLVNKLIQFCHPDKHDNDPRAGMITAELLEIKRAMR